MDTNVKYVYVMIQPQQNNYKNALRHVIKTVDMTNVATDRLLENFVLRIIIKYSECFFFK